MDILILRIMKYFIAIFTFALYAHCCAQFIPQPMGYNPDENLDGLIGAGDLQGLLALYGNTFDNEDSLEIGFFELPEDFEDFDEQNVTSPSTLHIEESIDLVYLVQNDYGYAYLQLPSGDTWKVLQVFIRVEEISNTTFQFVGDTGPVGPNWSYVFEDVPRFFTLIRGHDGHWYFPDHGVNY